MKRCLAVVGALALVVASGIEARAQTMGIARGKVVDQDGAPVADAKVQFEFLGAQKRGDSTETNDKGEYTLMISSGSYRVTATKDGYQGTYQEVRVSSGAPTELPILQMKTTRAAALEALAPVLKEFERAEELMKAGKMDEATAVYLELKETHPEIPEVYFNLGTAYARQEKWAEAEAAFQEALEKRPDSSQARVMLAEVHKNMGKVDEALADMEKLIAESPDDPQLRYNLGVFYLNAQLYEEAYGAFDEARKLDPDNVDVLYLLGTISVNLGEIERAVGLFESYLEKAPEDGQYRDPANKLLSALKSQ